MTNANERETKMDSETAYMNAIDILNSASSKIWNNPRLTHEERAVWSSEIRNAIQYVIDERRAFHIIGT